jgi:hypothetical protein
LYAPPNIIYIIKSKRIRWARHVAHMEEMKNIFIEEPEGKIPFGRSRLRCEDNIKMELREKWGGIL